MSQNGQPPEMISPTSSDERAKSPDVSLVAYITGYKRNDADDSMDLRVQVYGTTDMLAASSLLQMAANVLFAADDTNADQKPS